MDPDDYFDLQLEMMEHEAESKTGYTLDPVGTIRFANEAIIAQIDVRW